MKFGNYLVEKRVDTTQNASVTELFPALAFNNNKILSLPLKSKKIIKKERFFNFLVIKTKKFIFLENFF